MKSKLKIAVLLTISIAMLICTLAGCNLIKKWRQPKIEYTLNEDGESYSVTGVDSGLFIPEATDIIIRSTYDRKPVTGIGDHAFRSCKKLKNVEIPDTVVSIGDEAFGGCRSLTSIEIPDSVLSIGKRAFQYCNSLESVAIGKSVTSIGYKAFSACDGLTRITVDEDNAKYHSAGNCIIETEAKTLVSGCQTSIIPTDGSVTCIGENAFAVCSTLTSMEIPDNVTSIKSSAFEQCTGLASVIIGKDVTSIEGSAFLRCSSLIEIEIPDNVEKVKTHAFSECSSLTSIAIGKGVTDMEWATFNSSKKNLTSITVAEDNPKFHSAKNCLIETERKTLIAGCKKSVIPKDGSVTRIESYAFSECSGLESIEIPDGVTVIGQGAFENCHSLTSVEISDSVTYIEWCAFYQCSSLSEVNYDGSIRMWKKIKKDMDWGIFGGRNIGSFAVRCTDGRIATDGTVTYFD